MNSFKKKRRKIMKSQFKEKKINWNYSKFKWINIELKLKKKNKKKNSFEHYICQELKKYKYLFIFLPLEILFNKFICMKIIFKF